jgi:hypothetical protein
VKDLSSVNTQQQNFKVSYFLMKMWKPSAAEYEAYMANPTTYTPAWRPKLQCHNQESGAPPRQIINEMGNFFSLLSDTTVDSWGRKCIHGSLGRNPALTEDWCLLSTVEFFETVCYETFDLRNFPVDTQSLSLMLESESTRNNMRLHPNPVAFTSGDPTSCDVEYLPRVPDFQSAQPIFQVFNVGKFDRVALSFKLMRRWQGFAKRLYSVSAILSLSTCAVFFMDPKTQFTNRVSLIVTLMLTQVAFQFSASAHVPLVPYNTLFDAYTQFSMCLTFAVMAECCGCEYFDECSNKVDSRFGILFVCSWLSLNLWVLIRGRMLMMKGREILDKPHTESTPESDYFEVESTQALLTYTPEV